MNIEITLASLYFKRGNIPPQKFTDEFCGVYKLRRIITLANVYQRKKAIKWIHRRNFWPILGDVEGEVMGSYAINKHNEGIFEKIRINSGMLYTGRKLNNYMVHPTYEKKEKPIFTLISNFPQTPLFVHKHLR